MPVSISWYEIIVRLALTMLAGTLIGLNRWERGRVAGLRTSVLVTLAASVAMIQANALLRTTGKYPDSFVSMDVMRLPLGILSGMGFSGAGAILRQGRMVIGVTTAATLWFATIVGLCIGGGQKSLGLAALGIGLVVLWCFRWLEGVLRRERVATLMITTGAESRVLEELPGYLRGFRYRVASWSLKHSAETARRLLRCEVRWTASPKDSGPPFFVSQIAERSDVVSVKWIEAGGGDM